MSHKFVITTILIQYLYGKDFLNQQIHFPLIKRLFYLLKTQNVLFISSLFLRTKRLALENSLSVLNQ